MLDIGSYVKTKTGKSGIIRNIYNRKNDTILVILLKGYSCYCCTLEMIE